eukprot:160077-Rhodomonas_salina.1
MPRVSHLALSERIMLAGSAVLLLATASKEPCVISLVRIVSNGNEITSLMSSPTDPATRPVFATCNARLSAGAAGRRAASGGRIRVCPHRQTRMVSAEIRACSSEIVFFTTDSPPRNGNDKTIESPGSSIRDVSTVVAGTARQYRGSSIRDDSTRD